MSPRLIVKCSFIVGLVLSKAVFAHADERFVELLPPVPIISAINKSIVHIGDTVEITGADFDGLNTTNNKVFFVGRWLAQLPDVFLYDSIQADILL